MGVTPNFTIQDLDKLFEGKIETLVETVTQSLQYVGERFVVNVRTKINADESYREAMRAIAKVKGDMKVPITEATPRYSDDTGKLTASVGFLILDQGKQVHSQFDGTGDGATVGANAAKEVATLYPSGTILVVVAGMQYAAAVESLGYDVLTGSSFIAERELKEALQFLQKQQ